MNCVHILGSISMLKDMMKKDRIIPAEFHYAVHIDQVAYLHTERFMNTMDNFTDYYRTFEYISLGFIVSAPKAIPSIVNHSQVNNWRFFPH